MKIIFDSSSLISFTDACLLGTLKDITNEIGVEIVIPEYVAIETIDKPLKVHKYMIHAVRIKNAVNDGWIKVEKINNESKNFVNETMEHINDLYSIRGHPLQIIQKGEVEALALIKELGANVLAVDERTTRLLIENPEALRGLLERRHHQSVEINKERLHELEKTFDGLVIVRSIEIAALAFKRQLINRNMIRPVLYALKYNGCGISEREIKEFMKKA